MLLLARLMQGLAMGGETSSGGSYIVESAPSHRRGFSGSFFYISVGLGTLCASLTGTFLTYLLPKDQMESYGWRLVFVLGALLGIFGLYLRRSIGESEVFKRAARTTSKKDRAACAPSCSIIGRACCESFPCDRHDDGVLYLGCLHSQPVANQWSHIRIDIISREHVRIDCL